MGAAQSHVLKTPKSRKVSSAARSPWTTRPTLPEILGLLTTAWSATKRHVVLELGESQGTGSTPGHQIVRHLHGAYRNAIGNSLLYVEI